MWDTIKEHWPKYAALIVITVLGFYAWGCPAKVNSIMTSGKKVTRPELQIELDTIMALAEMRMLDLDRQDQFRQLVLSNALLLVQGGTLNPVGLATAAMAIFGTGVAVKNTAAAIKKKKNNSK